MKAILLYLMLMPVYNDGYGNMIYDLRFDISNPNSARLECLIEIQTYDQANLKIRLIRTKIELQPNERKLVRTRLLMPIDDWVRIRSKIVKVTSHVKN